MLNVYQIRTFDNGKSHLASQKDSQNLLEYESSRLLTCRLENIKPIRMFISGVVGTSKSFLMRAIKCLVDRA
uniref:Uncharacterized protein n=1 Tax=Amphimedon queenslandica TaxID=400682 RepID=A0A1X7VST1_AMPQE